MENSKLDSLKGRKLILRPFTSEDTTSLAQIANNKKVFDNVRDSFPHPYKETDATNFINFAKSHDPNRIFAIEIDGKLAGSIGIHPKEDVYRKSAEIGYFIGESFWGKGIATQALLWVRQYAFETFDFNRLYAGVFEYNKASEAVLLKCGFKKEGILKKAVFKNGKIYDEHLFAITR